MITILAAAAALSAPLATPQPEPAPPPPPPAAGAPATAPRSAALKVLMDEHFEALLRRFPELGAQFGDERFNDLLTDESPEAHERWNAEIAGRLARLEALDRSSFTEEDHIDADLLIFGLRLSVEGARFHGEQMPVSSIWGPQVGLPQMAQSVPLLTPKHYTDYAARLERAAAQIDQQIEQMRRGIAAGRVQPRIAVEPAVPVTRSLATESVERDPTTSPFYRPFLGRSDGDAAARARAAITGGLVPAYRRLAEFLEDEYLPAARATIGAGEGVDGIAAYDHALRGSTTTELTADEIHNLGLAEVARIRAEMFGTIARTDFSRKDSLEGDELFAEFVTYLRTDPRFYHTSPETLLTHYRDIAKRVDAELPRLFGVMPRTPYGVEEIPRFSAPTQTTAYYQGGSLKSGRPGMFMANTYALDQRPTYEAIALTMHEAVPGHHLQIALAQELEGVHPLRTLGGYTAFVEGWALYSERLGLEVGPDPSAGGLYADPYDDFGRLTYEMWRACRLVVDTGIHAKRWPRQRAIDFMLANTALSPLNISREVDRYIGWPGQACGYKIGELKIRELRARAEEALGDQFDLRAFHDTVLGAGALPLPVLEARIDRWIAGQGGPAAEAQGSR